MHFKSIVKENEAKLKKVKYFPEGQMDHKKIYPFDLFDFFLLS
jgi:hypothetical protein